MRQGVPATAHGLGQTYFGRDRQAQLEADKRSSGLLGGINTLLKDTLGLDIVGGLSTALSGDIGGGLGKLIGGGAPPPGQHIGPQLQYPAGAGGGGFNPQRYIGDTKNFQVPWTNLAKVVGL